MSFLLATHAIARFSSLRQLARTLDRTRRHLPVRRALVVAAPNGLRDRPLYTAGPESASIRMRLEGAGFDVPPIDESRLTAAFFTERLSYVDALHIAAHGESIVGTEYLALPNGRRLSVDDLLQRHQRSLPFVYLNTCQLGRTRYLGGGQSRGLAFTLSELGAPAVIANTANVLDDAATAIANAFYAEALTKPVGEALRAARHHLIGQGVHPALVARVILFGDPHHALVPAGKPAVAGDLANQLLDAYFDGRPMEKRIATINDIVSRVTDLEDAARLQAAFALVKSVSRVPGEVVPEELEDHLEALTDAITLADELHHAPSMGVLRLIRAQLAAKERDGDRERDWLQEAVAHLSALPDSNDYWSRMLMWTRAEIRRRQMRDQGLEYRVTGPKSGASEDAIAALIEVQLSVAQAAEEETPPVGPRAEEATLDDMLWNAVVAGHPNRFEDTIEASAYSRIVARKIIAAGYLSESQLDQAHLMLAGVLWYIWSSQNLSYLERDLVEGHVGTLGVMIREVREGDWVPAAGSLRDEVLAFPREVDQVIASLAEVPWERSHIEIEKRIAALTAQTKGLLAQVQASAPRALAGVAAFISGSLVVKNTFTPLEGQDDMHKHLSAALNTLNANNEGRFMSYLVEGFEPVRNREFDELARWRSGISPSKRGAARETQSVSREGGALAHKVTFDKASRPEQRR